MGNGAAAMTSIVNRLKKLELVKGQVNEVQIVDRYLDLIQQSTLCDPIPELPDFHEFRQMQIKGG